MRFLINLLICFNSSVDVFLIFSPQPHAAVIYVICRAKYCRSSIVIKASAMHAKSSSLTVNYPDKLCLRAFYFISILVVHVSLSSGDEISEALFFMIPLPVNYME